MKAASSLLLLCITSLAGFSTEVTVQSPDQRLAAILNAGKEITITVRDGETTLLTLSSLGFAIKGKTPFGADAVIDRTERRSCDTTLHPPFREKMALLRDHFNELNVTFTGGYGLIIRVYNEGVAYRLVTNFPESIFVQQEPFALTFADSVRLTYQSNRDFWSAYENPYMTSSPEAVPESVVVSLPILADLRGARKVLFTEAQIEDYPALWLKSNRTGTLLSTFPGMPLAYLDEGKIYTRGKVTTHAPEIARTEGTRSYPWRLFIVAREDADLLTNTMVYRLGAPSRLKDVSWITPGLVTLDWWGRRNLFGVDFTGGVNTATLKYFVDFATHYGIKYILLDEGWTPMDDLLTVKPAVNIEEVLRYARSRKVKVILWAVWSTLQRQWDAAFDRFSRWKVDGIKVDFMNRDDQEMVNFYYRVAQECAKRKMIVLFHGAYKPDGMSRTYPHLLTREGLIEFEQNQVNFSDSPLYHTILPFIRMVAGPADYLPGTIYNAQKSEFAMLTQRPMGQGTRAHTMALCVLLESPIRMLPDSPSDYYREDACTRFITAIPVEWDDIHVLKAKVGEVVAVARKRGTEWYVGAVTNWDARDISIDCSFLPPGQAYAMTAVEDGSNADKRAIDHRFVRRNVTAADRFPIHCAPGGGWVARFTPVASTRSTK
jgi:alpha-glucosidase